MVITDIAVLVSAFFTLKISLVLILPLGYSVFVFSAISVSYTHLGRNRII